jgi:hypothetical protein
MATDFIQRRIASRAETLGMTAYAIAKAIAKANKKGPTEETVKRYLAGRSALNSRYVSAICRVLELDLVPIERRRSK